MMLKQVVACSLFLFALAGFAGAQNYRAADFPVPAKSISFAGDEREIHKLINKERRKKGLSELEWSGDLEKMAQNYSKKMADEKFFSHYERNGNSVAQRAANARIKGWRKIGENLFMSEPYRKLNSFAVEQWMKSPLHRQNILNGSYNTTGIGIAEARDGTIYITQIFIQK